MELHISVGYQRKPHFYNRSLLSSKTRHHSCPNNKGMSVKEFWVLLGNDETDIKQGR